MLTDGWNDIYVAGGGPAGAAAAIAARLEGCPVKLYDRASTSRHKVCGEFISPLAGEILAALQVWDDFLALSPRRIRRCVLHFGSRTKEWNLPECAWGLSRLELDRLLLDKAALSGAIVSRGERLNPARANRHGGGLIVASGRKPAPRHGDRLFGFKAHFEGPCDDAVELFFHKDGYAGVGGIEGDLTNVCGIAPESILRTHGFDFDEMLRRSEPLAERLRPLQRKMPWIAAGPLFFSAPSGYTAEDGVYPAGDSLGFVDPYTGTGILNALLTGRLAGIAAARRTPSAEYLTECRALLGRPFLVSSVLRYLAGHEETYWMTRWIPGETLFQWTRAGRSAA
jgi:flavin-dependent dehydrogenase